MKKLESPCQSTTMNEPNRTGAPIKKVRKRPASSAKEWAGGGILTFAIIVGFTYARNHFDEKAKRNAQIAQMQSSLPPVPATQFRPRPKAKIDMSAFPVFPIEEGKAAGIEFAQANTRPPTVATLDAIVTAKMNDYDARYAGEPPPFPRGSDYAPPRREDFNTSFKGTKLMGRPEPPKKAIPDGITPRSEYERLFRQGFQQGYREATTPAF